MSGESSVRRAAHATPGPDPDRVQQHHRRPARLSAGRRALAAAAAPRRYPQPAARREQGGLPAPAATPGLALAVSVRTGRRRLRRHRAGAEPVVLPGRGAAPRGDALRGVRSAVADVLRLRRPDRPDPRRAGALRPGQHRAVRRAGLAPSARRRRARTARGVLAGQSHGRSDRRGDRPDRRRHPAGARVPFPDRTGRCLGPRTDAVGAGDPSLLLSLGFDARRGAVRGGQVRRADHAGGCRAAGAADAGRPQGPARRRPLPQPVAGYGPGAAHRARPSSVRAAVRHRTRARDRARRRRAVADHHGAGAPLHEAGDRALRRADRLRRRRHLHRADDRPPRLPVGRDGPDLRRRSHPPFRPARGDAADRVPPGARNRSPSTPPRSLETSAPGC